MASKKKKTQSKRHPPLDGMHASDKFAFRGACVFVVLALTVMGYEKLHTTPVEHTALWSAPVVDSVASANRVAEEEAFENLTPDQAVQVLTHWAADMEGTDRILTQAIALVESSGNPSAMGPITKNGERACGLMQLMPITQRQWKVKDCLHPIQNARAGAKQIAWLSKQYAGDIKLILIGYNWGPSYANTCSKRGCKDSELPAQTRDYLRKVTATMAKLRKSAEYQLASVE